MDARRTGTLALLAQLGAAPRWAQLGSVVLLIDGLLLLAHTMHHLVDPLAPGRDGPQFFLSSTIWSGGRDGSLLELFGHLQLGVAGLLLLLLSLRRSGHLVFAAWGVVFLAMVADDRFRLHERAGRFLDLDRVAPSLTRSGAQELGGLLFWTVAALDLGAVLVLLHRGSGPVVRCESWVLLATIAPLGVVAVGYVLLNAVRPELLDGPGGAAVIFVRVTVKLLTMTAVLMQAARLFLGPDFAIRSRSP